MHHLVDMKRKIALSVLLAAVLSISAAAHAGDAKAPPPPFTPKDDVAFLDAMLPHHQMGVEMAKMVIARGESEDVRKLAQRIVKDQTADIQKMKSLRGKVGGTQHVAKTDDPEMDAMMAKMKKASGDELDMLFLHMMIAHHGDGLNLAHRAMPHLTNKDVMSRADKMFSAQAKDIGEMHALMGGRKMDRGTMKGDAGGHKNAH